MCLTRKPASRPLFLTVTLLVVEKITVSKITIVIIIVAFLFLIFSIKMTGFVDWKYISEEQLRDLETTFSEEDICA